MVCVLYLFEGRGEDDGGVELVELEMVRVVEVFCVDDVFFFVEVFDVKGVVCVFIICFLL